MIITRLQLYNFGLNMTVFKVADSGRRLVVFTPRRRRQQCVQRVVIPGSNGLTSS